MIATMATGLLNIKINNSENHLSWHDRKNFINVIEG